eukprot:TRINITY_DN20020_c1_g1_i1.p2 TRINITY_DN20020_c1_g1~~TRINITY_DN20020_c1_g1_i1.p2  ORF type:complete len:201 (-),score=10.14 TRINITY_DN20020_c1_g1_i1:259-861(-)
MAVPKNSYMVCFILLFVLFVDKMIGQTITSVITENGSQLSVNGTPATPGQNYYVITFTHEQKDEGAKINPVVDARFQVLLQAAIDARNCSLVPDAIAEDRALLYFNAIQKGENTTAQLSKTLLGQLTGTFSKLGYKWDGDTKALLTSLTNGFSSVSGVSILPKDSSPNSIRQGYDSIFNTIKINVTPLVQRACSFILQVK